ncbi:transposase [Haloarcula nitratireducens]|uniref:transposase n=1 Tax=Haloarcula nitratireducens TaxID=2487749 RepID=UPI001F487695|nr:transposase [Halomicroarcula nitratireducens]
MTKTITRTVVATLLEPTAHKEEKLQILLRTYREAFEEAFSSGATTQYQVNEIVTPYDLTSYAKDALKQCIPRLRNQHNAEEVRYEQPVRLTNRGVRFDHSTDRTYEFCWRVPLPGHSPNIWIPLQINPDQHEHWHEIIAEEVTVGEVRLQYEGEQWSLSVPIKRAVEETLAPSASERTPVGFDVGESNLLVGCATEQGKPRQPLFISGKRARKLQKERHATLKRLQSRNAASWRITERKQSFQDGLDDIIEKASKRGVEYAQQFENPVIVLEDLATIRERFDYGSYMNRRLHRWAFNRLQTRLEDKAVDIGIPVQYVNPAYTSKICHQCKRIGTRHSQAEFCCENEDCWVSTYQADLNAAINIARRSDPWGESCRVKSDDDDIPRDGRTSDSVTGQRC